MGFRLQIRIGQAEVLLEGEASLSIDSIKDLATHLNEMAAEGATMSFAPTKSPLKRVNLEMGVRQPVDPSDRLEGLLRNVFDRFAAKPSAPLLLENGPTFLQRPACTAPAAQARH